MKSFYCKCLSSLICAKVSVNFLNPLMVSIVILTLAFFIFGLYAPPFYAQESVAPMVSAGGHSLALKEDGTVWAWGRNFYGYLGDGTTIERHTPVQVLGPGGEGFLTSIVSVSAGTSHSLALRGDGTVWAWGYNSSGQLGDGTTTNRHTPVQVLGPDGEGYLSGIVSISATFDNSLVLREDGTVWAWGNNSFGWLGDGTTKDRHTPVQVLGPGGEGYLSGIVLVSTSLNNSLALREDGTVWAWGANWNGQLGDGTTTHRYTPVQVLGPGGEGYLKGIVSVSTGSSHALALREDGTVWAWGKNGNGEVGDGTTIDRHTPVQVLGHGGDGYLSGIVSVSIEWMNSLSLKEDGTVWTWGGNWNGQLGDGTTTDRHTPVQVLGPGGEDNLSGIVSVSTGSLHSLALKQDGTVWAWGSNWSGELGDGTTKHSYIPVQSLINLGVAPQTPTITSVSPASPEVQPTRQPFTIVGDNFETGSEVLLTAPGGTPYHIPRPENPDIKVTPPHKIEINAGLTDPGTWQAKVINPDGQESNSYPFEVRDKSDEVPGEFTVTVSANPSVGGTANVSDDGTFNAGDEATITAVANEGYLFKNWTEYGAVVSQQASYSFTVDKSYTLVANFEKGTHRVAYIPVKYPENHSPSWQPKPDHDIDVLKYKAEMVEKYFQQQSYGQVEIVSDFIYDDWETFTKDEMDEIFKEAGVNAIPREDDDKATFANAVLEVAIEKAFKDESDRSIYDEGAIVVINPIGGNYQHFPKKSTWWGSFHFYKNKVWTSDRWSYGVWAHEIGHAIFDWQDYYDAKKDLSHEYPWTLGNVGLWDLMGIGYALNPPAPIMTHLRVKEGWLDYSDLNVGSKQPIKLLHETELNDTVYRYHPETDYNPEYFIIEGRHPPDGLGDMEDHYWSPSKNIKKNEGIVLYEVYKLKSEVFGIEDFVFYIPYNGVFNDRRRVSLEPSAKFEGNSYKCAKSEVEFIATRENSKLNIEIKEYKPSNKNFIYIDYSYPIYYASVPADPVILSQNGQSGFGDTGMSPTTSDSLGEASFDFHLTVYCEDGRLVGYDPETGQYRIEIEGALASGSRGGGGPEWIAVPDDIKITYDIIATPAIQWMEETGLDNINFEVDVITEAIDDIGERTITDEVTFKIELLNVNLNANPEEGGEVSGGGVFEPGEEVTVTATASEGYEFLNWMENGEVVSNEAQYTFTIESGRDLIANFAPVVAEGTLDNLNIGDRVVDPSWQWEYRLGVDYCYEGFFGNQTGPGDTKPVTWIVVAKNHYGPHSGITLLAEELIGLYTFDNSTDRECIWGSNHWGESGTTDATLGLRPWLNSSGIHSDKGFYHAFSTDFQSAVVQVSIPNKEWQAGKIYTTMDRVFIPSTTELGDIVHNKSYEIGSVYPFFSGTIDANRIARLGETPWWYWTRSPASESGHIIRGVYFDGVFLNGFTDSGGNGVRPALNLKPDTLVSAIENADGAYEIVYDAPGESDPDPDTAIYWQNNETGLRYLWFMDRLKPETMGGIGMFGAGVWNIVGVGDLDGDGKTDIIWHNTETGLLYYWLMDGRTQLGAGGIGIVDNLDWRATAVGDMNGNGSPDIIWENTANGRRLVWFMDGVNNVGQEFLAKQPDPAWSIVAAADMNGNGQTDLILQNADEGLRKVWLMNGMVKEQKVPFAHDEDLGPEWQIAAAGDLNHNGHNDIVWENHDTGLRYVWFMDGLDNVDGGGLGTISDMNWQIAGLH